MKEIKLLSIAENPVDQEQGLKYFKSLPAETGMLFSFQRPRILSFWMKDTYVPLDIAFIDKNNKIANIQKMVPLSLRSVSSGTPCLMALEVPMGTLETMGVTIGNKIEIDKENRKIIVHEE